MSYARYPGVPWPWVGLLLALVLLLYGVAVNAIGVPSPMLASFYRVGIMTVLASCVALILLPPRRIAYIGGFLVCAGLIGYALYLQYVLYQDPCPLCILQRICVIAIGIVFLIAAIHRPGVTGAGVYAFLVALIGISGASLAARQVWLQALPKDQVPACGMGLSYMLDTMPYAQVLKRVLEGSGECAEKGWELLHLAIPGWTFVFFIAMVVAAIALLRRDP